jgi:hypothetical protein
LNKEADIQKVHPSNTRALKLIEFLGFMPINPRSAGDSLVFKITKAEWIASRKKYDKFSGVVQVLDEV